jgi:membrane protein implicated in regulation of membrane protease activity
VPSHDVAEPQLERQGRRIALPAGPFLIVAVALAVPGFVLLVLGDSWVSALGIVMAALAGPPAVVGLSLLAIAAVARWTARRRPFA